MAFYDTFEGYVLGKRRWRLAVRERLDEAPAGDPVPLDFGRELVVEQGNGEKDPTAAFILPTRVELNVLDPGLRLYDVLAQRQGGDVRLVIEDAGAQAQYEWELEFALETLLKPRYTALGVPVTSVYAQDGLKYLNDEDWRREPISGFFAEGLQRLIERPLQYVTRLRATNGRPDDPPVENLFLITKMFDAPEEEGASTIAEQVEQYCSILGARMHLSSRGDWRVQDMYTVGQAYAPADRVAQRRSAGGQTQSNALAEDRVSAQRREVHGDARDGRQERVRDVVIEYDLPGADIDKKINHVRNVQFVNDDAGNLPAWTGSGDYTANPDFVYQGGTAARCARGERLDQDVVHLTEDADVHLRLIGFAQVRSAGEEDGVRSARVRVKIQNDLAGPGGARYGDPDAATSLSGDWSQEANVITAFEQALFPSQLPPGQSYAVSGWNEFQIDLDAPVPLSGKVSLRLLGPAPSGPDGVAYFDFVRLYLLAGDPDPEAEGEPPHAYQYTSTVPLRSQGKVVDRQRHFATALMDVDEAPGSYPRVAAFVLGAERYGPLPGLDAARVEALAGAAPLEATVHTLCPLERALMLEGERYVATSVEMDLVNEETTGRWFKL